MRFIVLTAVIFRVRSLIAHPTLYYAFPGAGKVASTFGRPLFALTTGFELTAIARGSGSVPNKLANAGATIAVNAGEFVVTASVIGALSSGALTMPVAGTLALAFLLAAESVKALIQKGIDRLL